jgi:hypothetical protein
MTERSTHADLAEQLRDTIARLRMEIEARSDATLVDLTEALELLLQLTTHVHDHAVETAARVQALERGS